MQRMSHAERGRLTSPVALSDSKIAVDVLQGDLFVIFNPYPRNHTL